MKFKTYLNNTAIDINELLRIYNKLLLDDVNKVNTKLNSLIFHFTKICEGGKRLRATLVKLGFEMQCKYNPEILKPALAYEIFQAAILAHDDIIDKSLLRRGNPSLFTALGGDHYGISQAICLGDVGLFNSNILVAKSLFNDALKNKAITSFLDVQYKTSIGELLDVELPYRKKEEIQFEDILVIYKYKTAYYTFIGPLQLGAILGGADETFLEKLRIFGENLGIAFQIKDDILGVFGEQKIIGKSITTDIEEGKITILWFYAFKNANQSNLLTLQNIYGKKNITVEDSNIIQKLFIETGAYSEAQNKINEYVINAKREIKGMTINDEYKGLLYDLCDYMIERDK